MIVRIGKPEPGELADSATEHVRIPVTVTSGGEPTVHPVSFALTAWHDDPAKPAERPSASSWRPGTWDDGVAQCLIGPSGALNRGPGRWSVWVELTAPPEVAVRCAPGYIMIR